MGVGKRVRQFRKRAGLTQEGLADAIGVSRQAVSRWEHEDQAPSESKLEAIAQLLGVRGEDLIGVTVYPDMSPYDRMKILSTLRAETIFVVPVSPSSIRKNETGAWVSSEESADVRGIPANESRFSGKPLAVVTRGASFKNLEIPGGSTVLIDSGVEVRPGGISLVMMYGEPRLVQLYRAGTSDFIVEDGSSRERLDKDAQADSNFEIVGPVVEIRTYL